MKRLNETTGQPFKRGDIREDGFVFLKYRSDRFDDNGFFHERWMPEDNFKFYAKNHCETNKTGRYRRCSTISGYVQERLRAVKKRAFEKGIPFDLDLDYLLSIYVEECPALKIKLDWQPAKGQAKDNTPSLDKIVPELGYVKGNVQWLSMKANTMKSNASLNELELFAKWILNEKK